jgi:hypothetical protein
MNLLDKTSADPVSIADTLKTQSGRRMAEHYMDLDSTTLLDFLFPLYERGGRGDLTMDVRFALQYP